RNKDAAILQAKADAARYKSLNDLHAAVQRGELRNAENPWYNVQLKQEVARNTALHRATEMRDAYLRNADLTGKDDLGPVERHAEDSLMPALDGTDVWEAEAMAPVIQSAKHDLLAYHVELRNRMRPEEREFAAKEEIANILS